MDQSAQPLLRLATLLREIDEQFTQQLDRIAYHQDEENNDYRVQEVRLSALMLDKTISDEKHLEYARKIIALNDTYKQGFIRSLQTLNDAIERDLLAFEQTLNATLKQTPELRTTGDMERWLRLSKELQEARVMATTGIIQQVEFDKLVPSIVDKNSGRSDLVLSDEESTRFKDGLIYAELIKTAYNNDQKIQKERKPLTTRLLPPEPDAKASKQSTVPLQPTPKPIHPLEGKAWFRLLKVAYFALGIVGLGLSALLAFAASNFSIFVGGAIIVVVVLLIAKKVFYYVALGRTTAKEIPGKGFVDLEDLRSDFAAVQANNPDVYREVVEPFFDAWKSQYGRRIPTQAVNLLVQRVDHEMSELKEKKQQIINKAAREGGTIEISKLRENLEKTKADFQGPDRQQYARQIDNFVMSLEAKYGTAIPVDEASKLLDKLEEDIEAEGKAATDKQPHSSDSAPHEQPDFYAGRKSHWSETPGPFERHLQRREGNPMFPEEFREPSPQAIDAARAKDDEEFKAAEQTALAWVKGVRDLGEGCTIGGLAPFHKSAGEVMIACAKAGEKAEVYRNLVKNIDDNIADQIVKAMESVSAKDGARMRETEQQWMALRDIGAQPLLVQLSRKNGPISEDEHVAVLLCESVQSVNEIVAMAKVADMTDAKGWFQKARVLADRAKRAGCDIPAVEEKLSALKSISGP